MKRSQRLSDIEKILNTRPLAIPKWLKNYQVQTLFTRFFPHFETSLPKVEKISIKLPEGSQIVANCWFQTNREKHQTIIALSGFEGYQNEKDSRFIKSLSYKAYHWGYNFIHFKQRAEGDTLHLTTAVFGDYLENDLEIVLKELEKLGIKKVYLTGFSAGGGLALLYTGRYKNNTKHILGVVAISAPTSMLLTWKHVEKHPFYNQFLLRSYKNVVKRRLSFDNPDTWDKVLLKNIKTKRQWFETYMHMWGYPQRFNSVEEYDELSDVSPLLDTIAVPTLIIHAYDDPITPIGPYTHITNPNVITLFTKYGGHMGFFTNKNLYGDIDGQWAQNRAIEFFRLLNGDI
jgi:uncharacterized protein